MTEEAGRAGGWSIGLCGDATPRDRANQRRFALWCLGWAVAYLSATLLLKQMILPLGPATWLLALAPTLIGLGAVRAYLVFLREADELTRRIQLESLAWAFAAGALFMTGWRLLERAGAPVLDMGDGLLVMALVWAAGQLLVARRYQ